MLKRRHSITAKVIMPIGYIKMLDVDLLGLHTLTINQLSKNTTRMRVSISTFEPSTGWCKRVDLSFRPERTGEEGNLQDLRLHVESFIRAFRNI